jgi:CheY-like chemotaxis protein
LSVLVVDDNTDSAESLALLLEMSGHRSRIAHDGPSALRTAESFAPDVMLLDIGLPDMNGYEVARLVRTHPVLRDVFLVAVTGWGSETDKSSAHAAGIDVHLTKPIDYPRLLGVLARAADGAGRH